MKTLLIAAVAATAVALPSDPDHVKLRSLPSDSHPVHLNRRASTSINLHASDTFLSPHLNLSVGTPPQTLTAQLDVESGDTVVGSSPYDGEALYAPNSTTLKQGEKITYRINSWNDTTQGTVATDVLQIGEWKQESSFVLANPSGSRDGFPEPPGINTAVLGLGYKRTISGSPLSSGWDQPLWGLYLAPRTLRGSLARGWKDADTVPNVGSLSLGKTDPAYMDGEAHWLNLTDTSNGSWAVPLTGVSLGGKSADMRLLEPINGTQSINVGSYYSIGLPGPIVDSLLSSVSGAKKWDQPDATVSKKVWTLPCDTKSQLVFNLGGKDFPLSLADWVSQPPQNGTGDCEALLYPCDDVGMAPWIGTPLLQTVYSVWDLSAPRLGLAPVKGAANRIENGVNGYDTMPNRTEAAATTTGKLYPTPSAASNTDKSGVEGLRPVMVAVAMAALGCVVW